MSVDIANEPLRTTALRAQAGSNVTTLPDLAQYGEVYEFDFDAPDWRTVAHFYRVR